MIFASKESSNSEFNCCSANLLLEETDEQLSVLQIIPREQGVIAALYLIIGNDQVSQFKSDKTKFFYKVFSNNVGFITGELVNAPGSLGDLYVDFVSDTKTEINAFCSVIWHISSVYLNKIKPAFPPKTTAETLLSQIDTENFLENHKRLLEAIRGKFGLE